MVGIKRETWINLGWLGLGLAAGLGLIYGSWIVAEGGRWIWKNVPFGVTGISLGSFIWMVTFFFARKTFPKRKFELSWYFLIRLDFWEISGYLLGSGLILASLLWFFIAG